MAQELDIVKVNNYLELANYPYYDEDNAEAFAIFQADMRYTGNADINVKTAYLYSLFVNIVTLNATGYAPAILQKLAYNNFITNGGESL